MEKFKLKESLYPDIEIEVRHPDGTLHTYKAAKYTEPIRIIMEPLDEAVKNSEDGAEYNWVKAMFGIPDDVINTIPIIQLGEYYMHWINCAVEIQNMRIEKHTEITKQTVEKLKETVEKETKSAEKTLKETATETPEPEKSKAKPKEEEKEDAEKNGSRSGNKK